MWGVPSSAGWRHSATPWSRRSSRANPDKSRIIYMITGHRALGFGEIAASYGETIVRQVRYRSYSQVSQHFSAITGREPESFRDFLLRATSGSPADCIAGSPFPERHRA